MAGENSQNGGLTENDDVRRKALLRLGVAAVVTAAALAGLWWLDQGGSKKPEKPVATALPAPIVAAPLQESVPPQAAPDESAPAGEQAEQTSTPPEATPAPAGKAAITTAATPPNATTTAKSSEAPPPPKVSNAPKILSVPAAVPRATPAQPPATLPATVVQPPAMPPAASGERFVLQLGVFSNPERARELVNKLNKQGIRAHMETRVHLGPFANREEAEKAQVEMRKLGMQTLITPAAATK